MVGRVKLAEVTVRSSKCGLAAKADDVTRLLQMQKGTHLRGGVCPDRFVIRLWLLGTCGQ